MAVLELFCSFTGAHSLNQSLLSLSQRAPVNQNRKRGGERERERWLYLDRGIDVHRLARRICAFIHRYGLPQDSRWPAEACRYVFVKVLGDSFGQVWAMANVGVDNQLSLTINLRACFVVIIVGDVVGVGVVPSPNSI